MESILKQLYYGEISPAGQSISSMEHEKSQFDSVLRMEHDFSAKLSEPMKQEFSQVLQNYTALFSPELADTFSEGFRLGARLMLEILQRPKENF